MLTTISTRELRAALRTHLAAVQAGATITVTEHRRPVARISPVDTPSVLEQLIAEGVIQPPARGKRPAPHPVVADAHLSDMVLADRRSS